MPDIREKEWIYVANNCAASMSVGAALWAAAGQPRNIWGAPIEITENLDGNDGSGWPSIGSNGVKLPP